MKLKTLLISILLMAGFQIQVIAQIDSSTTIPEKLQLDKPANSHTMNFVKINLLGIVLKNYQLQYERILSRKFSISVGFRTMPLTGIPFKKQIVKAVDTDDPDTKTTIENIRLSNYAITPEVRFYVSRKGFGRGFYIAPFYRHSGFTVNNFVFTYENSGSGDNTINLSGKLTSNTGGILFGVQKLIGKHISIDTWILGPHYGSCSGIFSGVSATPLTPDEQQDLRDQLEGIDIPLTNKTVNVNANGASLKLDGPWGGVRAGLCIGVRF